MIKCERCDIQHEGKFGSGRFCSISCANSKRQLKGITKTKNYKGLSEEQISEKKRLRSEICRKAALVKAKLNREEKERRLSTCEWEELLSSERKERVLREQKYCCAICSIGMKWNNKPLSFDLDHINGDRQDNSRDNLRCLCPNCHSQTPTYKSKNAKGKRYSDAEVIIALKNSDSVYSALNSLGMNLHGGNYTRVRKIVKQYDLKLNYLLI